MEKITSETMYKYFLFLQKKIAQLREILKRQKRMYKYFLFLRKRIAQPRKILKKQIQQLRYILFEIFSGIDIKYEGIPDADSLNSENCGYQPLFTWYLKQIMKCFSIKDTDLLLDYGSGKGAAMIFFSHYPFREIGGVELIRELHEIAERNFKRKRFHHLTSYNGDVTNYEDIDKYNYFFFCNPFRGEVLDKAINQIQKSFIRNPRKIIVIYATAVESNFIDSGLFPYRASCFVPSIINFFKNNRRYARQFIDIYSTHPIECDLERYKI
jgi:hypothetical protein